MKEFIERKIKRLRLLHGVCERCRNAGDCPAIDVEVAFLKTALEEQSEAMKIVLNDALRYINHYQDLLNNYDGGERKGFKSIENLITELNEL